MLVCEFEIIYTTQKAIKEQALGDHLAEHPMSDYEPLRTDFPDEILSMLLDEYTKEAEDSGV